MQSSASVTPEAGARCLCDPLFAVIYTFLITALPAVAQSACWQCVRDGCIASVRSFQMNLLVYRGDSGAGG